MILSVLQFYYIVRTTFYIVTVPESNDIIRLARNAMSIRGLLAQVVRAQS